MLRFSRAEKERNNKESGRDGWCVYDEGGLRGVKIGMRDAKQTRGVERAAEKIRPSYAGAFRCIGASCEDGCCGDWDIPVDKATYGKYRQFPPDRLGGLVSEFVVLNAADAPEALYARIQRPASGACPFFGADRLCRIQQEYGPQLLSATCSIYPRSLSRVEGELEGSLSLSCPEAARNVLLRADFAEVETDLLSGDFRTDNFFVLGSNRAGSPPKPYGEFPGVRAALVAMVRDRSRPLWLRLLRIGWLCQRMDEVAGAPVAGLLDECRAGEGLRELESTPGDATLRLEIVLALTDERMRDGSCGRRFRDTFWAFIEGIGSPVAAAPGSDLDRLLYAEETYCRPFFERSPYVLENYLLNYVFQNLFPFGRQGSADFVERSMFDEYLLMTTQFAWIHTLLIGIAANYKESFADEHVVSTVQSFTRSVEHYPEVLASIVALVRRRGLDNLQGMAFLLKIS